MIYERQEELKLEIPKSAVVIGLGGVGSWVALNLALVGVPELLLIDPDRVEETNLNRTPYKYFQIGEFKTDAVQDIVVEHRFSGVSAEVITDVYENADKNVIREYQYIIDCRDTATDIFALWEKDRIPVIGGYDGLDITLHFNPSYSKLWGESTRGYQIIPSFLVPCQMIACIIAQYLCSPRSNWFKEEKVINFSTKDIISIMEGKNG